MTYDKDTIEFAPFPTHCLFKDITGKQFGRLTVIGYAGRFSPTSKKQMWFCECECGTVKKAAQGALQTGLQSCGCLRDEKIGALRRTHGLSKRHPLYNTWLNIRRRCHDPNFPKYPSYGERGIEVCQRWRDSFENFVADMGEKPSSKHSIERKDNDGNYEPGNCKWALPVEQSRNQRSNRHITFNGRTQVMAAWCEELGLPYGCISSRLNRYKWSIERALTTPVP